MTTPSISEEIADISARLQAHEAKRDELRREIVSASEQIQKAKTLLRRTVDYTNSLGQSLHYLKGLEVDCAGHDYESQPSGRGIGFDEVCTHCGYCKNFQPVY